MPTEVLTQLRALRESIADSLRKDPRFLTLAALDKSIAEISGVVSASGAQTDHPPLSSFELDAAHDDEKKKLDPS